MHEVKKHVDKLFAAYPKTDQTLELKEEVIGNLEAEIQDLQSGGASFADAFRMSTERLGKLDGLIDGVKSVRIAGVATAFMQWALIYTLIIWILTIPLSILPSMIRTSWVLFIIILLMGTVFLILYASRSAIANVRVTVNLVKLAVFRKIVWGLWSVFVVVCWLKFTGLLFGSNIWFSRPLSINGPYEFATIVAMYATPAMTIIIPLLFNKMNTLIGKQEEGTDEE